MLSEVLHNYPFQWQSYPTFSVAYCEQSGTPGNGDADPPRESMGQNMRQQTSSFEGNQASHIGTAQ
jgi:hypothetical protein